MCVFLGVVVGEVSDPILNDLFQFVVMSFEGKDEVLSSYKAVH